MKLDKHLYELARARACKSTKDFETAGIPKVTLYRALNGENIRPETAGRIAKVLGLDVAEIIKNEK